MSSKIAVVVFTVKRKATEPDHVFDLYASMYFNGVPAECSNNNEPCGGLLAYENSNIDAFLSSIGVIYEMNNPITVRRLRKLDGGSGPTLSCAINLSVEGELDTFHFGKVDGFDTYGVVLRSERLRIPTVATFSVASVPGYGAAAVRRPVDAVSACLSGAYPRSKVLTNTSRGSTVKIFDHIASRMRAVVAASEESTNAQAV